MFMADKIIERIHFTDTNEIKDVEREMTAEELAQYKKDQLEAKTQAEAETAKNAEKAALLAQLGITEEQAKLLLS